MTYREWEREVFKDSSDRSKLRADLDRVLCSCSVPTHLMVTPPPNAIRSASRWHILDDVLLQSPVHRINVAMAIVKAGHEKVLNRWWSGEHCTPDWIWKTLIRVSIGTRGIDGPDFVTLADDDMPAPPGETKRLAGTPDIIGDYNRGFELTVPVMSFGKVTAIEREGDRGIARYHQSFESLCLGGSGEPRQPQEVAESHLRRRIRAAWNGEDVCRKADCCSAEGPGG